MDMTADYEKFGNFWEHLSPSNRWGGTFKRCADGNHFERNDKPTK